MNYTLLNQFEKFIESKHHEYKSPISLLPYLCLKHNYDYLNMVNELKNGYVLKKIYLGLSTN